MSQGIHNRTHLWSAEPRTLSIIPKRLHLHSPPRPNQLRLSSEIRNNHSGATRLRFDHSQPKPLTHRCRQQNVSCCIHGCQRLLREPCAICVLINNLVLILTNPTRMQQRDQIDATHRTILLRVQIQQCVRFILRKNTERQQVLSKRLTRRTRTLVRCIHHHHKLVIRNITHQLPTSELPTSIRKLDIRIEHRLDAMRNIETFHISIIQHFFTEP